MLFQTCDEYDDEITFVREQIRLAISGEKWRLNTSQSDQKVEMNLPQIQKYLVLLTTERTACIERCAGAGVTAITVRRSI